MKTRRTVFGTVAGAVAAILGIAARPAETDARRDAKRTRRPNRDRDRVSADGPCGDRGGRANRCQRDRDCCTGICRPKRKRKFGRCRCRRSGQPCRESRNCCRNGGQTLVCTAGVCTPACGFGGPCRVFRTAQAFQGNFGGALDGDALCQTAATTAGLNGTFRAWLSDATTSPSTRFFKNPKAYILLNGTVIADNWDDLTDDSLQNRINRTEYNRENPPFLAWTGTNADGTLDTSGSADPADSASARTCTNWTTITGGGSYGLNTETGLRWSQDIHQTQFCEDEVPLYCFEQAPPG